MSFVLKLHEHYVTGPELVQASIYWLI